MKRLGALIVVGLVGLSIAAGIVYLVWQGMLLVPPDTARLWALMTTALLPVVAWAGWFFGATEARGRLQGIDQAVDKVMGGMLKMAGLTTSAVRAMRQPTPQPAPYEVILPEVEIVPRQLGSGDIIEL